MKKKQIRHFVPIRPYVPDSGPAACNSDFYAIGTMGEVAKTRRGVTCGNCRRTRIFRKLK